MGRKKKEKNYYFSDREEQAVLEYIGSDSKETKDRIYNSILREPFRIMTESILRKYPTHIGNYDIKEVEANALSHLVEQMVKYNPNKILKSGLKPRAYSYCQTIIRNHYKDHAEKSYKEKITNLSFDDHVDDIYTKKDYVYEIGDDNKNELEILIDNVVDSIENVLEESYDTLRKNEVSVGYAVINILSNWNILFMEDSPDGRYDKNVTNKYEKSKVLFFLKEQTNLNTKEIRQALKPFKELYFIEKLDMINNR